MPVLNSLTREKAIIKARTSWLAITEIVLESRVGILATNICMFHRLVLSLSKLYFELLLNGRLFRSRHVHILLNFDRKHYKSHLLNVHLQNSIISQCMNSMKSILGPQLNLADLGSAISILMCIHPHTSCQTQACHSILVVEGIPKLLSNVSCWSPFECSASPFFRGSQILLVNSKLSENGGFGDRSQSLIGWQS